MHWDLLPLIWIANQFIFTSTCPYIVSRKYHLAQFYALKIWSGWKMLWKCFYLNCLGFEATGKPGRYLAFLGKLQIFQMVSIFIEHFKERNSKLNFPNLHVAEKLLSYQPCMHALGNNIRQAECQGDQGGEDVWYGWLTATTFQTTCPWLAGVCWSIAITNSHKFLSSSVALLRVNTVNSAVCLCLEVLDIYILIAERIHSIKSEDGEGVQAEVS